MRRQALVLLTLALLIVGLSCAGLGGASGTNNPRRSSGSFSVKVVNLSPDDICSVYISSSTSDSWGDSWLGSDVIAAGKTRTFTVDAGTYDLQVEDCGEAVMGAGWEFSDDFTLTVGGRGQSVRLLVENGADTEVCYVFISSPTAEDWGDDWMTDMEQIPQGGLRMFYVKPGIYDLMAADCDGETLIEEYEVDLNTDLTWNLYNR